MTSEERAAEDRELKVLQDAIYRDKVLRARATEPAQKFMDAFELFDFGLSMMRGSVESQLGTKDEEAIEREVFRRFAVVKRVHEHGYYTAKQPV